MRGAGIATLLGRRASDPTVLDLLDGLRIPRRPGIVVDEHDETLISDPWDWLGNRHLGIELCFEDEGTFLGLHPDDQGTGEMLLTQVWFYGDYPEMTPFAGRLPLDLDLADDRTRVVRKLSAWDSSRRSWIRDTWDLPRHRLTVGYGGEGRHIGFVRLSLYRARQRADREGAGLARAIQDLPEFIGVPFSDPVMQERLQGIRFERDLQSEQGMLVADYTDRVGAELQFRHLGGRREPVFAQATFLSDAEVDTIRWPGALPFGLTFDDSPERMLLRLPEAPARLEEFYDGSFVAQALWHFSRFTLLVEFSTMENEILRVQVMAPGVWTEA